MNPATFFRIFLLTAMFLPLAACGKPTPGQSLKIMPQDCKMAVSEMVGLTLAGEIDPNSQVVWEATLGTVVKIAQGMSANYTAPSIAGEAQIKATITSGAGSEPVVLTTTCKIGSPTPALTDEPGGQQTSATNTPAPSGSHTVIISEVMGNTCGSVDQRKFNQYVELYNHGDQPVNVAGLWLYDEGDTGTPDQITQWKTRSNYNLGNHLILDSTIIPAHGVGIVLPPKYHENPMGPLYNLPAETLVLTIAESDTLGDDYFGIIADQNGYDTVTLYMGSSTIIINVLDTYGTPNIFSNYPFDIEDDRKDTIPGYLSECTSVERIDPRKPDAEGNWRPVQNGTPGDVPFN